MYHNFSYLCTNEHIINFKNKTLMNKLLRYSFVVLMAIIVGNAWAGEPTKVLSFPASGGEEISSYTKEWTATVGTDEWILNGFNSNKNAWAYVKCGRKGNDQTATITSPAVNETITDFVVSIDKTSNVKSATLKVGDSDPIDITDKFKAGDMDINVSHRPGQKFVLTIESESASANGPTQISKIALYEAGQYNAVHIANTEETAYTIAEAIALIDKGEALGETVFVKGIISQIDKFNESYSSINYWISDDGTTATQLECYSGKGIGGAAFTSVDDLKVGAKVIVKGTLTKYNSIYEFNASNELVKYEAPEATTTYKITITNTEHGNITLDKYEAAAGEKVNVTGMTTAEGWQMEPPTITDANGNAVEIQGGDGGYYIIMPASNITIALNFIQLFKITIANYDKNMGDVRGISFNSEDDPIYKKAGKNVEFTVTAKQGFKIESVTVVDEDKNPISVAPNERNIYQFEMPAKNVTITAVFSGSVADTWTVAGTPPLTYNTWDPSDTNCDMTPNGNGEGVSSYERDNIVLEKGTSYEFKVVKNHAWGEEYPEQNYVIKVDETALYHVKIFFNTTTHEITYEKAKMGEAGPVEHTWSVIGDLVGNWDTDTDMTKGEDGLYIAKFENVAAGTYKFKVRADHNWNECYGGGDDKDGNSVINVESDGSTVIITFDAENKVVKAAVEAGAASTALVWDFTKWSAETVANLIADAAASKTEGWSDVEKKADAEAGADPTEAAKDNCFWFAGTVNEDGSLSANGAVIKELKGLKFDSDYAAKRSLAIAVNYPSTSLGDYAGGAYLWLGGGGSKQTCPCFTIPGVKAGSKITVELESHKPSDGRGIGLYKNSYAAENLIGEQFKPTTKDTKSWDITEDCDVVVWNTSGCHLYSLKVVEGTATGISIVKTQKTQNNAIYNLAGQKVGTDYKGIVIVNGRKFMQK